MTEFTIPKPMTEVPKKGNKYYVPTLSPNYHMMNEWEGDDVDKKFLKADLAFHTPEDAITAGHLMRAAILMYEALDAQDKLSNIGLMNADDDLLQLVPKLRKAALAKARGSNDA